MLLRCRMWGGIRDNGTAGKKSRLLEKPYSRPVKQDWVTEDCGSFFSHLFWGASEKGRQIQGYSASRKQESPTLNDCEEHFDLRPRAGRGGEGEPGASWVSSGLGELWVALQKLKGELERGTDVFSASLICGISVPRESKWGACAVVSSLWGYVERPHRTAGCDEEQRQGQSAQDNGGVGPCELCGEFISHNSSGNF